MKEMTVKEVLELMKRTDLKLETHIAEGADIVACSYMPDDFEKYMERPVYRFQVYPAFDGMLIDLLSEELKKHMQKYLKNEETDMAEVTEELDRAAEQAAPETEADHVD